MNDEELARIRTGPPGPDGNPIPDASLAYLLLGCFRSAVSFEDFPIKVADVKDNYDEKGTIQSFTIVTESGLRFTVHLPVFEEET